MKTMDDELLSNEDILLRVATKAYLEVEGSHYMELAEEYDPKVEAAVQEIWQRIERTQRRKRLRRTLLIAAVLLIVTAGVAMAAIAYQRVMDLKLEENGVYADVRVNGRSTEQIDAFDWGHSYLPTYLPSGYILTDSEDAAGQRILTYSTEKGETLYFYQAREDQDCATHIDNEADSREAVQIIKGGPDGYFISKGSVNVLYWVKNDMLFSLESSSLSKKELIKIAQSIKERSEKT